MKKILICLMLLSVCSVVYASDVEIVSAEPQYVKWGKLAMQKTKEKYPNAVVKDYEHRGRINGINTTMEKFKLWLQEGEREFGVLVNIEFDKETERVIDITFREVQK